MITDKFLSYKFIDSKGSLRDKIVRKSKQLEPTWFDGSSIGFKSPEDSDIMLKPDPLSKHYDPIRKMDSYFCFLLGPDGSPLEADFRTIAKKAMKKNKETKGALFGVEPEFYVCHEVDGKLLPYGISSEKELSEIKQGKYYGCIGKDDLLQDLRYEIVENIEAAGIIVESHHAEVGPGQVEVSYRCANLLTISDQMLLFKYIINSICHKNNLMAIFEAKPFENLNGSGCHVHVSVPSIKNDEKILMQFAQNLVNNYDSLLKICCSGETSLKRLVPNFEAPCKENNGIGIGDRTKTVRIPCAGSRVEFRLPDSEMNPYTCLSEILKYGIKNI